MIHDQDTLDSMADPLDNRPRQTLGWLSPIQVFRELVHGLVEKNQATIH